ncbi:MAG: AbrB/MazE/SpoVT family DNA-binding domain-containing protein, partial [Alphaproteobacteria bacterium]
MKTRVSRWGNSLAIRIPKTYAKRAGLEEGAAVEITARGDSITIRKPEYTLD